MDDPIEAVELERTADWRIRKAGEDPSDEVSRIAAKLLQRLADDVRGQQGSPVYTEDLAILNWLGEFDVTEDFAGARTTTAPALAPSTSGEWRNVSARADRHRKEDCWIIRQSSSRRRPGPIDPLRERRQMDPGLRRDDEPIELPCGALPASS